MLRRYSFFLLVLWYSFLPLANAEQEHWPSKVRLFAGGDSSNRSIFYVDYILPLYYSDDQTTLLFFNPKQSFTSPFSQELNLGAGIRKIFSDTFILGIHLFYDKKYSTNDIWHEQLGYGFEFLSEPLDFRFNYYDPKTKPKIIGDPSYELGSTHLLQVNRLEESLEGFDFEFGAPFFERYTRSRIYLGGFFYNSQLSKDVDGFRVRTETNLNPWLSLDIIVGQPSKGRTDFTGGLRVCLPLELSRIRHKENPLKTTPRTTYIKERLFERVVRDLDIRAKTTNQRQEEPSVEIIYADNSNSSGTEDGSLQHPYDTLAEAFGSSRYGEGKYIYIFKGDGTASGYTGHFNLADNVVLWGSGYDGGFKGIPTLGFPIINGAGTNILTLADNNTIMGCQIEGGISAIIGSGINGTCVIKQNNITSNTTRGISILNSNNLSVVISGNTLSNNANGAIDVEPGLTGTVTATISGNTITDCGGGIDLISDGSSNLIATVSGNTISDSLSGGIFLASFGTSTFSAAISGNTINNSVLEGIFLWPAGDSAFSAAFSENTVTGCDIEGVYIDNTDTSSVQPIIDFGGGALGSIGYNSIYGNTPDFNNSIAGLIVKAQHNWWGQSPPNAGQFNGDVDYDFHLTSAP